jgi:hypothetical protein
MPPDNDAASNTAAAQKAQKKGKAAQETPPSAEPRRPAGPPEVPAVPAPLPPDQVDVTAGWAQWGLTGNEGKFRQYATPPRGIFFSDIRFDPLDRTRRNDVLFSLKDVGQDDYRGDWRASSNYGGSYVRGFMQQNRSFDPSVLSNDSSTWRTFGLLAKQALNPNFTVSFDYRDDQERLHFIPPGTNSDGPTPYLDQRSRFYNFDGSGKVGGQGYLSISISDWQYESATQTFPTTDSEALKLSYLWSPADYADVDASFSHTWITSPGMLTNSINVGTIGTDLTLGPDTSLSMAFEGQHLDMPTIQNAWVRDQEMGSLLLTHRYAGWSGALGLKLREAWRINGDQTFVDVPRWTTVNAKLAGRLLPHVRLNLKGASETLSNAPSAITQDPLSLEWNIKDSASARLDAAWDNVNGYLSYAYQHWKNTGRDTVVNGTTLTAGGVYQATRDLSLFAEFEHQGWASSSLFAGDETLSNFLPGSDVGVVELTWNRGRRIQASLNFTEFTVYSDNPLLLPDQNTRGQMLTISGSYEFPSGDRLGLIVAPWHYTDTVTSGLNYNAAVVMVTGSGRF